jgi:hypothetical protein
VKYGTLKERTQHIEEKLKGTSLFRLQILKRNGGELRIDISPDGTSQIASAP